MNVTRRILCGDAIAAMSEERLLRPVVAPVVATPAACGLEAAVAMLRA